jgi:hypothetical protein
MLLRLRHPRSYLTSAANQRLPPVTASTNTIPIFATNMIRMLSVVLLYLSVPRPPHLLPHQSCRFIRAFMWLTRLLLPLPPCQPWNSTTFLPLI